MWVLVMNYEGFLLVFESLCIGDGWEGPILCLFLLDQNHTLKALSLTQEIELMD